MTTIVLPLLLSIWTLGAMYACGIDPRRGWCAAVLGQALWVFYTIATESWGFIPLNIGLTWVYWRNWDLTHRPTVAAPTPAEKALSMLVTLDEIREQAKELPEAERRTHMEFYYTHRHAAWAQARKVVRGEL